MIEVFNNLEIIGIIAFSVSGSIVAIQKKMDIFGIIILGIVTAIAGGIIRDIILGNLPPTSFKHPFNSLIAFLSVLLFLIPGIRKPVMSKKRKYELILLVMDSLGLAAFTVLGVKSAFASGYESNIFLQVFVGVITGVGGGVLRDVLAGNKPYIFVKHFYAMSSLLGAFVCSLAWFKLGSVLSMTIGFIIIFFLRICAAYFKWNLPKIN